MSGFIASIFLFFLKMARKSFSSFSACFWPHFDLSDLLNNLSKGKTIVYLFSLYRHECFTGKYITRKIHKNYIWDPSGLFSIISHASLSMT